MRGLEDYSTSFKLGMGLSILGLALQWSAAISTPQHIFMAIDVVFIALALALIIVQVEGRRDIPNKLVVAICIAIAIPALLNIIQVIRLHLKYSHTGIPTWTPVVGPSGSVLLVIGSIFLIVAPEAKVFNTKTDLDGDEVRVGLTANDV